MHNILCPISSNDKSLEAMFHARCFAQLGGGANYLLHVVLSDERHLLRKVYRPDERDGTDVGAAEWIAREQLEAIAQEYLDGSRYILKIQFNRNWVAGILEVRKAVGVDLVVVTTDARTGFAHLILGSIAETIVREATFPAQRLFGLTLAKEPKSLRYYYALERQIEEPLARRVMHTICKAFERYQRVLTDTGHTLQSQH